MSVLFSLVHDRDHNITDTFCKDCVTLHKFNPSKIQPIISVKNPMKTPLIVAVITLLVVGLVFGRFYFYGPCGTKVVELSVSELKEADLKYVDTFQAVSSSSRPSLSSPVGDLQKIEWTTGQLVVPACLEPARKIYIKGMQEGIDGLIAFSRKNATSVVNKHISSSMSLLDYAATELITISECAPFCKTNRQAAGDWNEAVIPISGCQAGSIDCAPGTSLPGTSFSTKHVLTLPVINRAHPSRYLRVR
jgi:hypothetical protein